MKIVAHAARMLAAAALLAVATGARPPVVAAQSANEAVLVVLPATFPGVPAPPGGLLGRPAAEPAALVVRFASGEEETDRIILSRSGANPPTLAVGLTVVRRLRERARTQEAGRKMVALLTPGARAGEGPPAEPQRMRELAAILRELRKQPPSVLEGVGRARWIKLPDARLGS